MAAPYNPPKRGEEFQIDIGLADMSNNGRFKASPTLAAGDFKVSKDGGALANLAILEVDLAGGSSDGEIVLAGRSEPAT